MAAKQKDLDAKVKASAELWTANMPEKFLSSFIQTKTDEIRYQLSQLEDSDSDSDSDSDDEWSFLMCATHIDY